jgi:hypothetical protein
MWMWSEAEMARRLDHERLTLARKGRRGLSIKDKAGFLDDDRAARWLKRAEGKLTQVPPHRRPKKKLVGVPLSSLD